MKNNNNFDFPYAFCVSQLRCCCRCGRFFLGWRNDDCWLNLKRTLAAATDDSAVLDAK